jgi:hypothetical protein
MCDAELVHEVVKFTYGFSTLMWFSLLSYVLKNTCDAEPAPRLYMLKVYLIF